MNDPTSHLPAGFAMNHIDTVAMSANEGDVGTAIRVYKSPREQLSASANLLVRHHLVQSSSSSGERSLHAWPLPRVRLNLERGLSGRSRCETLRDMAELPARRGVGAVGVSNSTQSHLPSHFEQSDAFPAAKHMEQYPVLSRLSWSAALPLRSWWKLAPLSRAGVRSQARVFSILLQSMDAAQTRSICAGFTGEVNLPRTQS